MRIVLDTTIAVKWYAEEEFSDRARAILAKTLRGQATLLAPDIIQGEFANSFRNTKKKNLITDEEAIPLWRAFTEVSIVLVPPFELMEDAIALCLAHNETASDGLFVALALREGLKVVTGDWRMHKAFVSTGCLVHISQFAL